MFKLIGKSGHISVALRWAAAFSALLGIMAALGPGHVWAMTTNDAPNAAGQTWLIMLYQDADDDVLEKDIFTDLNEAEVVGSTDRVQIVAQVDRFEGAFDGDGDWISTKRFYITQDDDLEVIASEELEDIGEANMSDGDTLVDFVVWAAANYPADKYVLILSDHGAGWPGGWNDPDPGGYGYPEVPMAEFGDQLFLLEIDDALGRARREAGIDMFELVGFDACLMGQVEVMSAIAPHARYSVASQEVEPSLGWAYASFLGDLAENPSMTGAQLAQTIVDSYIDQDRRIVDDYARGVYILESYEFEEEISPDEAAEAISAEELAEETALDVTLAAIDLSALPDLMAALDNFAFAMSGADQEAVAESRSYAQSYESVFGDDVPPSYIDLVNFAMLVREQTDDAEVTGAADALVEAVESAVIREKHGPNKPGSNGLSIYFPNSGLFARWDSGYDSYSVTANRFVGESLWDDFLLFHYTGSEMPQPEAAPTKEPTTAPIPTKTPTPRGTATPTPKPVIITVTPPKPTQTPTPSIEVVAPGVGEIEIGDLELSTTEVGLGETMTIDTTITGKNIAYIYFFAGYYDEEANSVLVADMDYVVADDTKEIGGVYYPDWAAESEAGVLELSFEWEPTIYIVEDGVNEEGAFVLLDPEEYGASAEEGLYSVWGIFRPADGSRERYASVFFGNDGYLRDIYGFQNEDGTGAPREIKPKDGDEFTVIDQWIDLEEGAELEEVAEMELAEEEGSTITFGKQRLEWFATDPWAGTYYVGFVVEDFDGNYYEKYEKLEVTEGSIAPDLNGPEEGEGGIPEGKCMLVVINETGEAFDLEVVTKSGKTVATGELPADGEAEFILDPGTYDIAGKSDELVIEPGEYFKIEEGETYELTIG